MKLQNVVLAAACLLLSSAGLKAENTCNKNNVSGTYAVTISGWATVGLVGGMPVYAPVKSVGTATIDADGALNASIISVLAGSPSTIPATGTVDVTSDCMLTIKATCSTGCAWTSAGIFVSNTKEASLVFTSQTSGGNPAPITASLDLKRIGN